MAASNTNDYVVLSGQKLDPKVFVDPHSGAPLPILVQSVGGGGATAGSSFFGALYRTSTTNTTPQAVEVSIANVGAASGTVGTGTLGAGETVTYRGFCADDTISPISIDATGTTFLVSYQQKAQLSM